MALAMALWLFAFGLSQPPAVRLRGDAMQYLRIAASFESLAQALSYTGDRSQGLPLLEFGVLRAMGLAGGSQPVHVWKWMDAVCLVLLALHLASAWLFALWLRRAGVLRTRGAALALFFLVAACPALIGHVTTPLTDTLAMDAVLLAAAAGGAAMAAQRKAAAIALCVLAGLLLGFSVTVRPAGGFGVAVALLAGAGMCLAALRRRERENSSHPLLLLAAAVLACLAAIAPNLASCTSAYGTVCLQRPAAFQSALSMQTGLKGARALWNKGQGVANEVPTLRDPVMADAYFDRCEITSVLGAGTSSLTGCLASRPLAAPVYVVKKWIGLFDYFRFTPYMEGTTPDWLRWLGRVWGALLITGLALAVAAMGRAVWSWRRVRQAMQTRGGQLRHVVVPAMLAVYCMAMLALHTATHVEERYSFAFLPLCAAALVVLAERAVLHCRAHGRAGLLRIAPALAGCAVVWLVYWVQVIAWDNTPFN